MVQAETLPFRDRIASDSPLRESQRRYLRWKYPAEYLFAALAALLLLPLFVIIPILIKLDSAGPLFFRQIRIGKDLRPFEIFKFRTMAHGAHELQRELQKINEMSGGGLFKSDHDPRITRVGRILRKLSLDELPQLLNILRGDMTIIGPRPLSTTVPMYRLSQLRRFVVKPGLGCFWQAYHRGETNFEAWIESDLQYIDAMCATLDLKLLFVIAKNTVLMNGAR